MLLRSSFFAIIFLVSPVVVCAEDYQDDFVVATIPEHRIADLLTEEVLFKAKRMAGSVDSASAISLAKKQILAGLAADDLRQFGGALATLESVPEGSRNDVQFIELRGDVASLLHDFQTARRYFENILAKNPTLDLVRRKLFYLELLQGHLGHASRHCEGGAGFHSPENRDLCSMNILTARGQTLSDKQLRNLAVYRSAYNADTYQWSADIQLDHNFLSYLHSGASKELDQFLKFNHIYLTNLRFDNTRLSYVADRLIMARLPDEALKILPKETDYFAVSSRRLIASYMVGSRAGTMTTDTAAKDFVTSVFASEEQRLKIDHAREGAMLKLTDEGQGGRLRELALANWNSQREWIDVWLLREVQRRDPAFDAEIILSRWSSQEQIMIPSKL